MKGQGIKGKILHLKRGGLAALFQLLLLSLLLAINGAREWYFAALLPLLGAANLAAAWFLHLRRDHFLGAGKEERLGTGDPPPWTGGFLVSGLLLLAAATAAYLFAGVGSRYFL